MTYVPQTPLVELRHDGGFIVSQANGHQSIDRVFLNAAAALLTAGTIIASTATTYAGTGTAVGGNTGNGTIGAIAIQAPALAGNYLVTLVSPTEFIVTNPNGEPVPALGGSIDFNDTDINNGPGTVGTVFNSGGVGFLVTAGSTPFVASDAFTIAVTETGGGWVPLTSASASITKYGILYGTTDTTNGPVPAAAFIRNGEVNLSELIFDASLTAAQQDAAVVALNGQGVIAR